MPGPLLPYAAVCSLYQRPAGLAPRMRLGTGVRAMQDVDVNGGLKVTPWRPDYTDAALASEFFERWLRAHPNPIAFDQCVG